jgi:hypothetical protein
MDGQQIYDNFHTHAIGTGQLMFAAHAIAAVASYRAVNEADATLRARYADHSAWLVRLANALKHVAAAPPLPAHQWDIAGPTG